MPEQLIDARGLLCPKPLILVKQALDTLDTGSTLRVLLDTDIARANVERFLADHGARPEVTTIEGVITVTAEKRLAAASRPDAASYCAPLPPAQQGPYVMVFASDSMGRGSDELGTLLVQACVNALPETSPRPDTLIFYNAGVRLVVEGSPVLDALRTLADAGAALVVCGTCLNYYQLQDARRVGIVSNMFDILERLARARKVVYP